MEHVPSQPLVAGLTFTDSADALAKQIFARKEGLRPVDLGMVFPPQTGSTDVLNTLVFQNHPGRSLSVRAGDATITVQQDALGYILTAPGGSSFPVDDASLQVASKVYHRHADRPRQVRASDASVTVTEDALGYLLSVPAGPSNDDLTRILPPLVYQPHGVTVPVTAEDQRTILPSQIYQVHPVRQNQVRSGDSTIRVVQDALGYSVSVNGDDAGLVLPSNIYPIHPFRQNQIRAGDASITVTQDALGYVLVGSSGVPGDDSRTLLPSQIYQYHPIQRTVPVDEMANVMSGKVYGMHGLALDYVLGASLGNASNPSALVGLTPINGSSLYSLRSDAAPALNVSISPTWTGIHTFANPINLSGTANQLVLQSAGVTGTITWTPTTSNKVITLPDLTGTIALGAGSLTVSSTNNVTVAAHTHVVTSSSNPGAAVSLLATDSNGAVQLAFLSVGIAPLTDRAARLQFTGANAGSTIYGTVSVVNVTGTTTNAIGLYGRVDTSATAFTLGTAYAIYAGTGNKGAGSTITTYYGLYIDALLAGTTNYAIYSAGAGLVRIGDTTNSSSTTTGSLIVNGGIGVGHSLTMPTAGYGIFFDSGSGALIAAMQAWDDGTGSSYHLENTNRYFDGAAWQQLNTRVGSSLYLLDDSLNFATFPGSSSTPTVRFQVNPQGVGVGVTPQIHVGLNLVQTDNASGATVWGITAVAVINNTTSNARGIYGRVDTSAAAFTVGDATALFAANPTKGAGSTITTAVGLQVASITSGTTNYAILTGTGLTHLGGGLRVASDGGGAAATVGYTNVVNTTITNTYLVKGGQAANTTNTGWLKIYIGANVAWVPYWQNATP